MMTPEDRAEKIISAFEKCSGGWLHVRDLIPAIATQIREAVEEALNGNCEWMYQTPHFKAGYTSGRIEAFEEAGKMLEDGVGGEGTTELQDATLEHYARKLRAKAKEIK